MKRNWLFSLLTCLVFLIGCSKEQTFEEFFHKKMDEMHLGEKDYSYTLIHKQMNIVHKDDAIAVFKERRTEKEIIFIAYLEKENDKWEWRQTRGAAWNSPVKWSAMNQVPFIYSGAINDTSISKVYAGNELAKIIKIEGDKRFWYAISDFKDVDVTVVKDDGSKEILKKFDEEI
ncbi:hypothetical protein [Cytobacillus dafuensis]|uniref:Lipoprotein n=1 Tax=Cytobacillus dafuensis TaxID=1742359 RepID=A0A5B8Z0W3_CYTDA|nr:hypothetical protein [Cytobacillus dafuensis]QED46590.1 hypothetical protein FSZ17_04470 [Cytobacillus dafuensis]